MLRGLNIANRPCVELFAGGLSTSASCAGMGKYDGRHARRKGQARLHRLKAINLGDHHTERVVPRVIV